MKNPPRTGPPLTRRSLLLGALAVGLRSVVARAAEDDAQAIRARAKQVGIAPTRTRKSGPDAAVRYLVMGDAPVAFCDRSLGICEGLAKDYGKHFEAKGLPFEPPKNPLTVVALSGPRAFAAFLGVKQEEAVGGIYDLATNRLVIFDNRARADAGPNAARANTVSLTHEATHQLTFNTGLLDREGDVPVALSEGLAMYAEVRRPDGRAGKIGDPNGFRLEELRKAQADGVAWLALEDILAKDDIFEVAGSQQLAYAQSWLLVHFLMTKRTRELREYLNLIRPRRESDSRLKDFSKCLGDPKAVEAELAKYASTLAR